VRTPLHPGWPGFSSQFLHGLGDVSLYIAGVAAVGAVQLLRQFSRHFRALSFVV
jgi:hypothetical protein